MNTDFDIYKKIVGIQKVKDNLQVNLSQATVNENWKLVQDITEFIKNNINKESKVLDNFINCMIEQKYSEPTDNQKYNKSFSIVDLEVWEKVKLIMVQNLEIKADIIVPETEIYRLYQTYPKTHNYNKKSNTSAHKNKNHWSLGFTKGLSAFITTSSYEYDYSSCRDIRCDDLDFLELIIAVEEAFGIEISDEKSEQIVTAQNLYDAVICCLKEQKEIEL